MTKNTPILIFTGLAVAAAGVLIAVMTGNYPGAPGKEPPVAEAPATTQPATPPTNPPAAEAPAQNNQSAATETPAAPAQPQAETQPETQPETQAETPAAAPAQNSQTAATETPAQPATEAQPQEQTQAQTQTESQPAAQPQQQASATPEAGTAPAQAPVSATNNNADANANPDAPSFDTVNVMPTGEAVVAGRGKPGSDVVLKFDGVEVGRATATADGSFAIIPEKPLPIGAGQLTLESSVGGQTLISQDQIAIVVKRDKSPALVAKVDSASAAPTKIVQAPAAASADAGGVAKDVQLSAVDYDSEGNIVFQGRVTPGGTVRFYVDNQLAGDVKSDEQGNWLFKGTAPIAPGKHMLRADEIDATGKVISRAELPFLREEANKVIAANEANGTTAAGQPAATTTAEQPAATAPVQQQTASASESSSTVSMSAAPGQPSRIVIQPGNNLWRISREVYGKGRMFTVIWEANRDQIKNPNRIYPGQILAAPKS
ncbi:LysM peptidoglycan-binding domain-containing protein [Aestuariivirga sp.]|uniref:LysM peptidoglycan-binding domain-containing protein n=1 Tax=Aestuariivirga sp. TaxID=2650926 RepID=UPI0039E36F22